MSHDSKYARKSSKKNVLERLPKFEDDYKTQVVPFLEQIVHESQELQNHFYKVAKRQRNYYVKKQNETTGALGTWYIHKSGFYHALAVFLGPTSTNKQRKAEMHTRLFYTAGKFGMTRP